MRMVRRMDAGPVLARADLAIEPGSTAGELTERCARLGADALVETLDALERGPVHEEAQDEALATYAPKLTRDDARIDWSLPAVEVTRWILGCDPAPAAWTESRGVPVQLFGPAADPDSGPAADSDSAGLPPGTVLPPGPSGGLRVVAGEGSVTVREAKPAGKRRMPAADWLRGSGPAPGERLE